MWNAGKAGEAETELAHPQGKLVLTRKKSENVKKLLVHHLRQLCILFPSYIFFSWYQFQNKQMERESGGKKGIS